MKQSISSQLIWKIARVWEEKCAFHQGKGLDGLSVAEEYKYVRSIIGDQANLILDIGGNIGEYTAEINKTNKTAEIHVFEPSKTNHEKLIKRFQSNPSIHIVNAALGSTAGEAVLYSDRMGSPLGSLTQRNLEHLKIDFSTQETVAIKKFDDYWLDVLNSRPISFAKIDVEGHELSVLKGFEKAIAKTYVVQFEFGGCNIDTKTYFKDFWCYFESHNFKIYRITPMGLQLIKRYRENDETFLFTNYLAINQNY
jgi:FkbM family methyltransferase